MANNKTGYFISKDFNVVWKNEKNEFVESFERLVKRTVSADWKFSETSSSDDICIILDLGKTNLEKSEGQELFIEFLIDEKTQFLPYVLVFGAEKKGLEIFNSQKYGKFSSIQLFTELCPRYYVYIPIPFEITEIKRLFERPKKEERKNPFERLKKEERKNPLRCFKTGVDGAKNFAQEVNKVIQQVLQKNITSEFVGKLKETSDKLDNFIEKDCSDVFKLFKRVGEYTLEETRKKEKREEAHKRADIELQIYDLLIAGILHSRWLKQKKAFNWCLIEDNPKGKIYFNSLELKEVLDKYIKLENYKYWIWGKDKLEDLKKSLEEDLIKISQGKKIQSQEDLRVKLEKEYNEEHQKSPAQEGKIQSQEDLRVKPTRLDSTDEFEEGYDKIDCILVDILLEDRKGIFYDGLDFLELLTNTHPEIPVLILSKSDECSDIKYAFERGANYYILKERTLTLPYYYYKYLDELGKLISLIEDHHLKRNLIGNIRYWHFKKDLLWFGNKCYHIVDHSFNHTKNVWELANQLLYPILVKIGAKDLNDDDLLYSFCIAIWLHDIGHKGNNKYGDPHEIRVTHPLISAELALQNPEDYNIYSNEPNERKRYAEVPFTKRESGVFWIKRRLTMSSQPKLAPFEKVALLCAYHKDNCPITEREINTIKNIPIDFYWEGNKDNKPITLESIISDKTFLSLAVLLRFIDGLDINKNRVGDINEKEGRKKVIEKDLEFNFQRLRWEVERIKYITRMEKGKGEAFLKLFYEKVRDEIRQDRRISDETEREQRYFLHSLPSYPRLENYELLKDHCLYLSVQEGHFDLHSSIEKVKIVHKPGYSNKIEIHYYSNKNREDLLSKKIVKEYWEKEEKSIAAHLLGYKTTKKEEAGYVIKKLNLNRDLLNDEWFSLDDNDIVLHTVDGKELRMKDVTEWIEKNERN